VACTPLFFAVNAKKFATPAAGNAHGMTMNIADAAQKPAGGAQRNVA